MSVPLVLVIEDSHTNRTIIREFLEGSGMRVIEAPTGELGTTMAVEHRPDVVVLDVVLPDTDGARLCRSWRKDPRLEHIPVLLISGERLGDEDRAHGLRSGALGYLLKPFSDVELLSQVNLLEQLGRLRRQLTAQNRWLEHSFHEIDQFARVISHDLKEPLETVANYCQLLQQRATVVRLDPESAELVDRAVRGARRTQHLIDDLLCYCRAGQEEPPWESVDLNRVLGDVVEYLDAAIRHGQTTVQVEPLPSVRGSRRMMVQLFQNLVSNAVKFTDGTESAVHVSASQNGKSCQIRVADNGIGIPPRDHDRIFGVFERLHPNGKRPGTGIGLAICKKIVDRHQGRIWVESEPGQGTTFHVELGTATQSTGIPSRLSANARA